MGSNRFHQKRMGFMADTKAALKYQVLNDTQLQRKPGVPLDHEPDALQRRMAAEKCAGQACSFRRFINPLPRGNLHQKLAAMRCCR